MGPGPVRYTTGEGADPSQQTVVIEEANYRLTVWSETDPSTGQEVRHLLYEDVDGTHMSGISNVPIETVAAPEAAQEPEQAPEPESEEGLDSFFEGAVLGDFSDNTSWSALAGQIGIGFVPYAGQAADARDLVAAGIDLYDGKEGAGWRLALSAIAVIPGVGDVLKAVGKGVLGGMGVLGTSLIKHSDEIEHGAERVIKKSTEEGAEKLGKEMAEDASDQAGNATAKAAGRALSEEARQRFTKELGEEATSTLLAKYGPAALEHYGPAFFKSFKGVTADTMQHLLAAGKISAGQIRGAHDEVAFLEVLVKQGNGEIVSAVEQAPGLVHYEYLLYQRGLDGKVLDPLVLQARRTSPKTVVRGLSSASEQWRARFASALENAIVSCKLPAAGGEFDVLIEGVPWKGYIRDGILDTIFPNL